MYCFVLFFLERVTVDDGTVHGILAWYDMMEVALCWRVVLQKKKCCVTGECCTRIQRGKVVKLLNGVTTYGALSHPCAASRPYPPPPPPSASSI